MKEDYNESLNQTLWNIADLYRGRFSVEKSLQHIFVLVSTKLISENNPIFQKNNNLLNILEIHWSSLLHLNKNIGENLNEICKNIENKNPQLKGVLTSVDFCSKEYGSENERDKFLSEVIYRLSSIVLIDKYSQSSERNFPNIFNDLITKFSRKNNMFYTSINLSNLAVRLLDPKEKDTICDSFCGIGNLLIECHRYLIKKYNKSDVKFYGQDINDSVVILCKINMLLNGIINFEIKHGNSLTDPAFVDGNKLIKFDKIISDIPLGILFYKENFESDKFNRFNYWTPNSMKGEFILIQHILSSLKSNGKAVIISSPGILFRSGSEKIIREGILKEDIIESIIQLPSGILTHTSIAPVIIIFNKNKEESRKNKVLFIDITKISSINKIKELDEDVISTIEEIYINWKEKNGISRIVDIGEIFDKDCSLNVSVYIVDFSEEKIEPIENIIKELNKISQDKNVIDKKLNKLLEGLK